jgi:hypothetical protein
MPKPETYPLIFERLKAIFQAHVPPLVVESDLPENYSVKTPASAQKYSNISVGAVQIKKSYVSFHLMPIYMFPALLEGCSPQLKKRMQGKACFNFTALDEPLFTELAQLTATSFQRFRQGQLP